MLYPFLNSCIAIHPASLPMAIEAFKRAMAGPVDDANRNGFPVARYGRTSVITMRGIMIKDAGYWARYGFAGTRDIANSLRASANDPDVDNIIWVIDSPGGSVDGLSELADTVKTVKQIKPITVQVDGMMASAALYAAANATEIYAGKRDMIGSIGTRIMLYDFSEMFEENGIKAIPIDTGEFKSAGAMGTEITESQKNEFQRIVDGFFNDFLDEIQSGRGLTQKTLKPISDGRIFFANEEPLDIGLIDGIRTLEETVSLVIQAETSNRKTKAQARLKMLCI